MPRKSYKQTRADKIGHKARIRKIKEDNPEFFDEIGSIGGSLTTTKFTSETGRSAVNRRWDKYRREQLLKMKGDTDETENV